MSTYESKIAESLHALEFDAHAKLSNIRVEELRKRYHKLALRVHPDKNADNLEECTIAFQTLTSAYEVILCEITGDRSEVSQPGVANPTNNEFWTCFHKFMSSVLINGLNIDVLFDVVKAISGSESFQKTSLTIFDRLSREH